MLILNFQPCWGMPCTSENKCFQGIFTDFLAGLHGIWPSSADPLTLCRMGSRENFPSCMSGQDFWTEKVLGPNGVSVSSGAYSAHAFTREILRQTFWEQRWSGAFDMKRSLSLYSPEKVTNRQDLVSLGECENKESCLHA